MYPLWTAPGYDAKIPDIRGWSGNMPEPDWQPPGRRDYTEKQSATYGALRLRTTEALSLVLGSRVTGWNKQASYNHNDGSSYPENTREQGVYTPYASPTRRPMATAPTWPPMARRCSSSKPNSAARGAAVCMGLIASANGHRAVPARQAEYSRLSEFEHGPCSVSEIALLGLKSPKA